MSAQDFLRTRPMARLITQPHEGCTGNCDQGRSDCDCPLAMPRAAVQAIHAAPHAIVTAPQPLETTPDAEWDGIPIDQAERRPIRLYAATLVLALLAVLCWPLIEAALRATH